MAQKTSTTLVKHATTISLVALGVMAAGYAMYQFRDNDIVKNARNGFQGVM